MLGNLKDMYQLQAKAREVQKQLEKETIVSENDGVKIEMNGKQEVLSVEISSELSKENLEKAIKNTFNDCVKKVQQVMAKSMMM